jgi:hypothetical protein
MAKDTSQQSGQRRVRWWVIVLIILLLIIGGTLAWVFKFSIQEAIGGIFAPPTETLPPPPGADDETQSNTLYQTSFEEAGVESEWEAFDDGTISAAISNGQLIVEVSALTDTGAWSAMNFAFDNFVLDVDASKIAGPDDNGIFVVFRMEDRQNYYRFDVSSDGFYALSKTRGGVPETVSAFTQSDAIALGDGVNHIRIVANGDTFRFFVNDAPLPLCVNPDPAVQPIPLVQDGVLTCLGGDLVNEWQDSDIAGGRVGLGAQAFVGFDGETTTLAEATVAFDNVLLQAPSVLGSE